MKHHLKVAEVSHKRMLNILVMTSEILAFVRNIAVQKIQCLKISLKLINRRVNIHKTG